MLVSNWSMAVISCEMHDFPGTNLVVEGKNIISDPMNKTMISNNGFQNFTNNRSQCDQPMIDWTATISPFL